MFLLTPWLKSPRKFRSWVISSSSTFSRAHLCSTISRASHSPWNTQREKQTTKKNIIICYHYHQHFHQHYVYFYYNNTLLLVVVACLCLLCVLLVVVQLFTRMEMAKEMKQSIPHLEGLVGVRRHSHSCSSHLILHNSWLVRSCNYKRIFSLCAAAETITRTKMTISGITNINPYYV